VAFATFAGGAAELLASGVTTPVTAVGGTFPPVIGATEGVTEVDAAVVVVTLLGAQPGCGMHLLKAPVIQKHQAHVILGGVQNWAILQVPVTRGGTK